MPWRRSTRAGQFRLRPKRTYRWQPVSVGAGTLTPDSTTMSTILASSDLESFGMTEPTIFRVHLNLVALITSATDTGEQGGLWFGICLLPSKTAATAVSPAIPDPFAEADSSRWLVHRAIYFAHNTQVAGTFDSRNGVLASYREVIDGKSRRRFDSDEDLVVIWRNKSPEAPTPAGDIGAAITGRVLLGET